MSHPIEALMQTAMENIQNMLKVETVVGAAIESPDGSVIIPISKVACGFAAGGSEFPPMESDGGRGDAKEAKGEQALPFGGGSGAGVSVQPVGFLVVGHGQVRLLPVDHNAVVDRVIDEIPIVMDKISGFMKKSGSKSGCKDGSKEDVIIISEH